MFSDFSHLHNKNYIKAYFGCVSSRFLTLLFPGNKKETNLGKKLLGKIRLLFSQTVQYIVNKFELKLKILQWIYTRSQQTFNQRLKNCWLIYSHVYSYHKYVYMNQ